MVKFVRLDDADFLKIFISAHARARIKHDASGKKPGKLSCCNCLFDQIKANLAEIQPENY